MHLQTKIRGAAKVPELHRTHTSMCTNTVTVSQEQLSKVMVTLLAVDSAVFGGLRSRLRSSLFAFYMPILVFCSLSWIFDVIYVRVYIYINLHSCLRITVHNHFIIRISHRHPINFYGMGYLKIWRCLKKM